MAIEMRERDRMTRNFNFRNKKTFLTELEEVDNFDYLQNYSNFPTIHTLNK